ncbi:MAG: hypothetical protein E7478_01920 [Ruminococcaceae bacterium]|nr:hypothetical protein [Oscillospiraceae bacterium]
MKRNTLSLLTAAAIILSTACTASDNDAGSSEIQSTASQTESSDKGESIATTSSTADIAETAEPELPEIWNPTIDQRQELKENGYLCAVAYIGAVEPTMTSEQCIDIFYSSRYSDDFPTITAIPKENCIDDSSGYELYLVIPTDENATVSINEWMLTEENEYTGETGKVYYRSEAGAPVLIRCNVSDIMPNVSVNIVDNSGNSVQWLPSLSLKDGSVSRYGVEDKVCDVTHYIYNETFECYQMENTQ